MKEDLNMQGQDYNLLQTMFTVGYCLGNIPSQLIMTKIRPSIWLPSLELIWSLLVMAMAAAKNVETLYVLRFFIGLLEASAYPGVVTLLANWYNKEELGKRTCIFISSSLVSQMFSGYLQAALHAGMDGKHGLRAWQWLFIFDGIIGIPVCLVGFFAIPDSPTTSKARWLTPEDKVMATARMEQVGRSPPKKLTWKVVSDVFSDWPVYLFSVMFAAQLMGVRIYNYFTIYLKSTGRYTVEQVNILPSIGFGLATAMTLMMAWLSDGLRMRSPSIYLGATVSLIGCIMLAIYPDYNHNAMMTGWVLSYAQTGASALIMTYVNEILTYSSEQRLLVVGVVETFGFVTVAYGILLAYPSGEAPRFRYGYKLAVFFFALEIVSLTAIWICERKWRPGPKN